MKDLEFYIDRAVVRSNRVGVAFRAVNKYANSIVASAYSRYNKLLMKHDMETPTYILKMCEITDNVLDRYISCCTRRRRSR